MINKSYGVDFESSSRLIFLDKILITLSIDLAYLLITLAGTPTDDSGIKNSEYLFSIIRWCLDRGISEPQFIFSVVTQRNQFINFGCISIKIDIS